MGLSASFVCIADPAGTGAMVSVPTEMFESYKETAEILADGAFTIQLVEGMLEADRGDEGVDADDLDAMLGL